MQCSTRSKIEEGGGRGSKGDHNAGYISPFNAHTEYVALDMHLCVSRSAAATL
jgi:hypothetical protein